MAVFPLRNGKRAKRAQIDLARLPVLVAACLIALFGLLAGASRNADIAATARPIDDRSDRSPTIAKREPLRAVTLIERRDGANGHVASDDGLPAPALFALPIRLYTAARAAARKDLPLRQTDWPGALPRAPPFAA